MLTLEQFKGEFPDLHIAVYSEGFKAGVVAGEAQNVSAKVVPSGFENLTAEERAAKMWTEDVELRMEFQGDQDAWMAFAKYDALGHVRIVGRRSNK